MPGFGSLTTHAFTDRTPDDYHFAGPDPQYYPLILAPAEPPSLMSDYGHLAASLDNPYSQSHVRPPQPRIDTTTYMHQAPTLSADQLMNPFNDVLGTSYPSPNLTPSTDSSHLTTPAHSPAVHRQHIDVMRISHSPISPSVSLYEPVVRLTRRPYALLRSSGYSMLPPLLQCLYLWSTALQTAPSTLVRR